MKLKDIIEYIVFDSHVRLFEQCVSDKAPELLFEGYACDIPWIYINYYLDNEDGSGAIIAETLHKNNTEISSIDIYITEVNFNAGHGH